MVKEYKEGLTAGDGSEHPSSIPMGMVSYGPTSDQIAVPIRRTPTRPAQPKRIRLARAIAVCSGKGGVGKSNIAVNLAVILSQLDKKVCLLDADLGLGNAHMHLGVKPVCHLQHFLEGRVRLEDLVLPSKYGVDLLPGGSGISRLSQMDRAELVRLGRALPAAVSSARGVVGP